MVNRGVSFSCRGSSIDEKGCYVFLHCSIENRLYVLANIYIDKVDTPVIVVGDFNKVLDKSLDRFPPGMRPDRIAEGRLCQFLEEMGLCDIWKIRNSQARQYSCFSSSYFTLSRIDMALGSWGVSDHSPLVLTMNIGGKASLIVENQPMVAGIHIEF